MALQLDLPYLFSLVLVQELSELRLINRSPDVERSLASASGLVGQWLHRVLERDLRFQGAPLHVFRPRSDAARADTQAALDRRLSSLTLQDRVGEQELTPILEYLRGGGDRDDAAIAVQQIVGRAFMPGYQSSERTYRAARVVDGWPRQPWGALTERTTRRLGNAKAQVAGAAHDDSAAIHATSIAMHNIVRSLDRLRKRYQDGDRSRLGEADLAAPALVVRTALRSTSFPFLSRPVKAGTVFLIPLDRLHDDQQNRDFVFLEREWSQCPAHQFVPNLLELAWERALASGGSGEGTTHE